MTPEVKSMWHAGHKIEDIEKETGINRSTLLNHMSRNRDEFPKRTGTDKQHKAVFWKQLKRNCRDEVEDPPKEIPVPEGARNVAWVDLESNECQWAMGGFWDKGGMNMPCCGLSTKPLKRFCEHHEKYKVKGW